MNKQHRYSGLLAVVFFLLPIAAAGFTPEFMGPEFRVNTYTESGQGWPKIAIDGLGNLIVVWDSYLQDGDSYGVYGQRYDSGLLPLGTEFRVNTTTANVQRCQGVAANASGDAIVTWFTYVSGWAEEVGFQRYDAAGNTVGGETLVWEGLELYSGGVVMTDAGYFEYLWNGYWSPDWTLIRGTGYDAAGTQCAKRINCWTRGSTNSFGGNRAGDIIIIYGNDGVRSAAHTTVCEYFNPGVPISNTGYVALNPSGDFVVFWSTSRIDTADVIAQRYDAGLNPVGDQLTVCSGVPKGIKRPGAAMLDNGNILFVWDEPDGWADHSDDVFARLYVPDYGWVDKFQVNENLAKDQEDPVVAASDDGAFIVAWQHIYGNDVTGWNADVYARGISSIPTGIKPGVPAVPRHVLAQNYPNPFAHETALQYQLAAPAEVTIRIYDVQGKLIQTIHQGYRSEGPHQAMWNGRDARGNPVSSGTYFYELNAGGNVQSRKMILLK